MATQTLFDKALTIGRPPTIRKLFPNSRALLVSGKVIDLALRKKGKAMTIAANGRNFLVIRGALQAAQRANAAIIIEIAKSEGTYCPVNFWNIARLVDAACNELGIKNVSIYPGTKHSTVMDMRNEQGLSKSDCKEATGHVSNEAFGPPTIPS